MQAAPVNVQTGRQDANAENASTGSASAKEGDSSEANQGTASAPTGGRRSGRSATMGSDEWSRQRKDNHVGVPSLLLYHLSYVFLFFNRKK